MSITIDGHLERDALAGSTLASEAVIVLQVRAGSGWPFEVKHVVGTTAEAHIRAQDLARGMRRGAHCAATGEQVTPRNDHGFAVLGLRQMSKLRVGGTVLV